MIEVKTNNEGKTISIKGTAKVADIKTYGLIKASMEDC